MRNSYKQTNQNQAELIYSAPASGNLNMALPCADDIEQVVLGACLGEKDALYKILETITKPEMFYNAKHRHIFNAMLSLEAKGIPIDTLTTTEELITMGVFAAVGGAYYLSGLTERVASSANIIAHARIIAQKSISRELALFGHKIAASGYEDIDAFVALDDAAEGIMQIAGNLNKNEMHTSKSLMKSALESLRNPLPFVASGLVAYDEGCPIVAGELTIIGARPGMGKTSLALSMAYNIAENELAKGSNKAVMFFSLEMSQQAISKRLLSIVAEVSLENPKAYELNKQHLESTAADIEMRKLMIDTTAQLKLTELKRKALQCKREHGIAAIFVDYLQLMDKDRKIGRSDEQIEANTQGLKVLANTLNVPIICLAQLNRATEIKASSIPSLTDLRGSGAIEQDADNVLFIYRPEYYQIETLPGTDESSKGVAQIIVGKRRNGSTSTFNLAFKSHCTKFTDHEAPKFF
jgi:replicative DNA helicase